jgi:hypothetical protein
VAVSGRIGLLRCAVEPAYQNPFSGIRGRGQLQTGSSDHPYIVETRRDHRNFAVWQESRTTAQRVYTFGDGQAEGQAGMKNLLGGKGANLAEMSKLSLPVLPGRTMR